MKNPKATTEMANILGPFNVERNRFGYHPEVNNGANFTGEDEGKSLIHVLGFRLPMDSALVGILVGRYRWESVLVHKDGSCTKFDVLHREVRSPL